MTTKLANSISVPYLPPANELVKSRSRPTGIKSLLDDGAASESTRGPRSRLQKLSGVKSLNLELSWRLDTLLSAYMLIPIRVLDPLITEVTNPRTMKYLERRYHFRLRKSTLWARPKR